MAARVTIMAGGTGGHVFPALAVAEELRDRGWDVSWLGTPDSFEARVVPAAGFELDTVQAFRLRGQGLVDRLAAPLRLLRAMRQARQVFGRRRPQVVLGMGGFVTGPGGLVSRLLGTPLVIHEQNAIPGMTNRWLARVARCVLEAFPGSFPARVNARAVGNPLRREITRLPPHEAIPDGRRVRLLVLGGSLGAQALNEQVPAALATLAPEILPDVRHQAGHGKAAATDAAYRRVAVAAEVSEFVDDMAAAYAWADLVICRAGALTVSELMAAGVAAMLVPFPFAVDDHQTVNAGYLTHADAAVLLPQSTLNAQDLGAQVGALVRDRGRLHDMGRRAYALARRDATKVVADVCEEFKA
jgi:UDP-N-acetylglucosamine--N-acetylmuramyl-(pentapeptide) pyrophosphoryl-undecaprenol N-acetylglucosamine transferase